MDDFIVAVFGIIAALIIITLNLLWYGFIAFVIFMIGADFFDWGIAITDKL